jgi:hypothetical protein
MRKISILAAVAVAALIAGFQGASAGLLGMPMGLHAAIQHIRFETPAPAPMAFTGSCLCDDNGWLPGLMFQRASAQPTAERWAALKVVDIAMIFSPGATTR